MDNKSDLEYLQNQTGKQAIIDTHVEGIEVEKISAADPLKLPKMPPLKIGF